MRAYLLTRARHGDDELFVLLSDEIFRTAAGAAVGVLFLDFNEELFGWLQCQANLAGSGVPALIGKVIVRRYAKTRLKILMKVVMRATVVGPCLKSASQFAKEKFLLICFPRATPLFAKSANEHSRISSQRVVAEIQRGDHARQSCLNAR